MFDNKLPERCSTRSVVLRTEIDHDGDGNRRPETQLVPVKMLTKIAMNSSSKPKKD
jgi:hypothetical protein